MNTEMIDPRDLSEKCLMTGSESRALKSLADELRLSKSKVLLLAFLKFQREYEEQKRIAQAGLGVSPGLDQNMANLAGER